MSNWGNDQEQLTAEVSASRAITLEPRKVKLTNRTGVEVSRSLPHRELRTIGAWCFVDYFGPTAEQDAMSVAAHPHTGLQTASWLFAGEVEHRDSLDSIQVIRPGELNLMTAGRGIAHSELSINGADTFHGVQLWIALPDKERNQDPHFEHHNDLPNAQIGTNQVKVFVGELFGVKSPAAIYSELVGAQIELAELLTLPVDPEFEYGVLVVSGEIEVEHTKVPIGSLRYLPVGNSELQLTGKGRLVLLGGRPFTEKLVMWWNFIGRSHEEIVQMRNQWITRENGFRTFVDQIGGFIPAPELPNLRLTARGNSK